MLNRLTLLAALLVVMSTELCVACNLCSPVAGNTMLTDLDAADVAFLAELDVPTPVRKNPTAFDLLNRDRQKGTAGFRIRTMLRGEADASEGDAVVVPLRVPGPSGTLHLITHNSSTDLWRSYRLSDDGLQFALGAAALPILPPKEPSSRSIVQRLAHCLRFLGTDDYQLRQAIFGEFSRAPYSTLQRLKPQLDREQVHQWMQPASRKAEEARLIFLLLAVCGDQADVPMLQQEFRQCVESNWAGTLDGVILAYVALGGRDALDDVDQRLLSSDDPSLEMKRAAAKSLKFLVNHESNIERPRLLLSCRLLLNDAETAQLIIDDYAQWQNWQRTGSD